MLNLHGAHYCILAIVTLMGCGAQPCGPPPSTALSLLLEGQRHIWANVPVGAGTAYEPPAGSYDLAVTCTFRADGNDTLCRVHDGHTASLLLHATKEEVASIPLACDIVASNRPARIAYLPAPRRPPLPPGTYVVKQLLISDFSVVRQSAPLQRLRKIRFGLRRWWSGR